MEIVGKHLTRAAKALVISKLIAIFHPRDRKSLVPSSTLLSSIRSFWQFFFMLIVL